ncbi:MAG TPA: YcxB family protein [Alloacidobacterium sp.]|nr:YcxB family protein [Alloacidobacterium sp.]
MELTYTITFEEYAEALRQRAALFGKPKSYYYTSWRAPVLLVFCLAIGLLLSQARGTSAYIVWSFLIAVYGLGLAYKLLICPRLIRKSYEQQKAGFDLRMTISETGLEVESSGGESYARYRWAAFMKQAESDRIFVLFFNPLQFVILPKRAMAEVQSEELRVLFGANISTKR